MSKRMAIWLTVLLVFVVVGGSVGLPLVLSALLGIENPNTLPLSLMGGFFIGQVGGTLIVAMWASRFRSF